MTDWLVIADDLTGAAEIAGIAYQYGYSVKLITGGAAFEHTGESMVVVNSGTRDMEPVKASAKVREILSAAGYVDEMHLFVKTDSLLRGNPGPELLAVLSATAYATCLLIPANPSKQRVIRQGNYYIGNIRLDETEYRSDPDYPRTTSDVAALLATGPGNEDTPYMYRENYSGKIMVPDISSADDIRMHTRALVKGNILPAGGADFFGELLIAAGCSAAGFFTTGTASEQKEYPDRKCFVLGSYAGTNRDAAEVLQRKNYSIYELPLMHEHEPGDRVNTDSMPASKWVQKSTESGSKGGAAAGVRANIKASSNGISAFTLSLNPAEDKNVVLKFRELFIGDPVIRASMLEALVETAAGLALASKDPVHFLVTGGKTASLFCDILNWKRLEVVDVSGTGIPTLRALESNHLLTVKPGSYDWPDFFLK
jgi:hypothetical protein